MCTHRGSGDEWTHGRRGEERRGLSACMPSVDAWKTPSLPALKGNQPWQTLISNFQPPEEGEDEFLWVTPHPRSVPSKETVPSKG